MWKGGGIDYILAGGTLTLDPVTRLIHARERGSPAAGATAGAAPGAERAGPPSTTLNLTLSPLTPSSPDIPGSEASPAPASDAPALKQVRTSARLRADLANACEQACLQGADMSRTGSE